jgi:glutamate synthase (NADPH/NADH) small chain
MPKPPEKEDKLMVWPDWPIKYRQSSSQAEGAESRYEVITTAFGGEDGKVKTLHGASCKNFQPVAGTEFELPADLVLLAMGFTNPVHEGMLEDLGVELDERGNVKAAMDEFQTSAPKVFAAGDMRRGQSLVVWAILEGRRAAHEIDKFLMGTTLLPR